MTSATLVMLSVLFPAKGWFAADEAWSVLVRPPQGGVGLVLTDFAGQSVNPEASLPREFDKEATVNISKLFPAISTPGAYILYAVPKGQESVANFLGTPLLVSVREDRRRGAPAGVMVVKVEPMRYAVIATDAGDMTLAFYYDVAPNTISNFIALASEKFYDGLTFHRIDPDFVIQGGDPRHDGTGGPGYTIDAEFSDRKHEAGAVSMARNMDPNESPANPPRPEYANSAGSQFFLCLNYKNTQQLDSQYSVFGRVVGPQSLQVMQKLAQSPIADKKTGRPAKPPVIKSIAIRPVSSKENPYRALLSAAAAR